MDGLRERKREQTRERIAETGLRLFLQSGYDETTLDAIAAAADISRRTFFHYFDSKEDILTAWEQGKEAQFRDALAARPPDQPPLDAMRDAMLEVVEAWGTERAFAIDRLMHSTEALRARKQANYAKHEAAWLAALQEKWPKADIQDSCRVVAMAGVGSFRLAAERWRQDGGKRPLSDYVTDAFDALKCTLTP